MKVKLLNIEEIKLKIATITRINGRVLKSACPIIVKIS